MSIIKIRLIGSNSREGFKLKNILKKVIKTKDYDVELEEINDKYGMKKNVPALIIDNELISQGKVLNENELNQILNRCLLTN